MISNQILQSTIDGLKSISRMELAIMDAEGKESKGVKVNGSKGVKVNGSAYC